MKRILITGAGSYIGTHVEKWLLKSPYKYQITTLDMETDKWKKYRFCEYEIVFHVAGVVHCNSASKEMYEKINHQLAVEVAKKAMDDGVKQFILMSSGAVYTQNDKKHPQISIRKNSILSPCTAYGISKMKAEIDIKKASEEKNTGIKLAILRPPMVYGPSAKGNYRLLAKFALKTPIFPEINNRRSMIYIDNLCEFIKLVIDNEEEGIFLPQNNEYINTTDMVKHIAKHHNHKIWYTKAFNWLVYLASLFINKVNKVFGSYCYEKENYFEGKYQIVDFDTSISVCEKRGSL